MTVLLVLSWLLASGAIQSAVDPVEPPPQPPAKESAPADGTDEPVTEAVPLPRVIVYPSRLRSISGYVLDETPQLITVRDRKDKVHEFETSLIYSLVHLHEIDTPMQAIVMLHDGRRREGLLEKDGFDYVQLRIHNVPHQYKREDVILVQLLLTFEEEYELRLQQLDETDLEAHLALCNWLVERNRLVEAKSELGRLLQRDDSTLARKVLRRVEARLIVQSRQSGQDEPSEEAAPDPNAMPPLVSDADVNLVRVYEIELDDPPKMRVSAATVQSLLDRFGDSALLPQDAAGQAAFTKADPVEIVEVMFALRARDLYGEITVMTEPAILSTFRRRIHDNWLLNSCGSRACHGGPSSGSGRFRLHWSYRPDDRIRTTNLLALNRLELDGQRMLDWSKPENALLYQYALPRSEATTPHPNVKGWKPIFTTGAASVREAYQDWVRAMINRHHQDWPVEYQPWSPPTEQANQQQRQSEGDPGQSR